MNLHQINSMFLSKNIWAKREWDMFKALKEKEKKKNCQARIRYLAKLSFRNEREIKSFPKQQNLSEFIITRPGLQEMLEGFLRLEVKG